MNREDNFSLRDDEVYVSWPERIHPEDIDDLVAWMELLIHKMRKRAEKYREKEEANL